MFRSSKQVKFTTESVYVSSKIEIDIQFINRKFYQLEYSVKDTNLIDSNSVMFFIEICCKK